MKYLPWIIIAVVAYFLLKKLSGGKTILAPQTQLQQVPQPDAYTEARSKAFDILGQVGIAQIGAETRAKEIEATREQNVQGFQLGQQSLITGLQSRLRELDIAESLGLKSSETDIAKANLNAELSKYLQSQQLNYNMFSQNAYLQQLQLYFNQREQDRQLQQDAINRYYSSRNTQGIIGSIGRTIAGIFGGGGGGGIFGGNPGGIYGTPPTFPSTGFGGSIFGGFGSGGGFDEGGFSIPPFLG